MKKLLSICILLVFLGTINSCNTVYFAQPQPIKGKAITQISKDKLGHYKGEYYDLNIEASTITCAPNNSFTLTDEVASVDHILLKSQGDLYYANIFDSTAYILILGKFYEDKLALYMLDDDDRTINLLKRIVTVEEFQNRVKRSSIKIDPTKKELSELIDMDLFSVIDICKKTE